MVAVYLTGILWMNILVLIVWIKDPSVTGIDFPTILLAALFSLRWPAAVFGDFMASPNFLAKLFVVAKVICIFAVGFHIERFIKNRLSKKIPDKI
jgi:hypothetical protein